MDADRLADEAAKHPRGVRNANPGNLRAGQHFKGEGDPDPQGYARFGPTNDGMSAEDNGIRAIAVDLLTKYRRGLVTVESIISVYAPPSENDTKAYVKAVADELGVTPYAWLHLTEGDVLCKFVTAIIRHECGTVPYSKERIARAVARADDRS